MRRRFSTEGGWRAALSGRGALIAFVLWVMLGGSIPVAIRFSNLELPPFWGATMRLGVAAAIFWVFVLGRRAAVPTGRALIGTVLYGAIGIGASNAFAYWALVRLQPGLASVFLAFAPLLTLFFAAAHGLELLNWRSLVGASVAVVGILIIVGGGLGATLNVSALLALAVGVACTAEGAVLYKLFPRGEPVATNAVASTTAAVLVAGLSLGLGEKWSVPAAASTWAAFAYLAVFGTVIVFYLYLFVLVRWPASTAAYGFVLLPVASVAISAWLTGEVVTISFVAGAAVVLAGVWLGAIRSSSRATASERATTAECVRC